MEAKQARRAQALRAKLRDVDADVAELRAALRRCEPAKYMDHGAARVAPLRYIMHLRSSSQDLSFI